MPARKKPKATPPPADPDLLADLSTGLQPLEPPVLQGLTGFVEPEGNRVIFLSRRALSSRSEEMAEVNWPQHWRLPAAGDHVRLPDGSGGYVEYVSWDMERRVPLVYLR